MQAASEIATPLRLQRAAGAKLRATSARFVLLTAARNELSSIEHSVAAVLGQTVRPWHWLIVSDGSTDGTDEAVRALARHHPWIELLGVEGYGDRDFAGKALALNAGLTHLRNVSFDYLGCMDADVGFPPDYFEFLLGRLGSDPHLGIVGTFYVETPFPATTQPRRTGRAAGPHDVRIRDTLLPNNFQVPGGCQVFRRSCLEDVGGFLPVRTGGIDSIATTIARMKGWRTWAYSERVFVHHIRQRPYWRAIRSRFQCGRKAYLVGGHPLWELSRAFLMAARPPYIAGGAAFFCGYAGDALFRCERPVSREFVAFHQAEQVSRLLKAVRDAGLWLAARVRQGGGRVSRARP